MNKYIGSLLFQLVCVTLFATSGRADNLVNRHDGPWHPAGEAIELAVWPVEPPAPSPFPGSEAYGMESKQIAGRPFTMVDHVSRPTLFIFRAKGKDTGTTIVVFPGGGYHRLAIDLEGTEICDWLTAKGITCVLLKYRVPGSGPHWSEDCQCHRIPERPYALQDAQRTMGVLRARAREWGIDAQRIGVLGFSAGGHLVADLSNQPVRSYQPVDAADQQSSTPNFAIALYPGHLWRKPGLTLNPAVKIQANCPPTLIVAASDDPIDDVRHSLTYYLALQLAEIPVEMHLYARGGHAFGVRQTSSEATRWTEVAEKWMRSIGFFPDAHAGR